LSDDLKAGRIAADHIGTTHHELIFSEDDYYEALPLVIRKLETYDPALVRCAVPCYFTCQLAAYYFQIFRQFHPQDSIRSSIGIWTGFDFAEERQPVQGTVDGDLNYHPMQNQQN